MRFSTKTEYGLKAMMDLALHEGQGPIPVPAIAKRQSIPKKFLEQILHQLRKKGLVQASRGALGGYSLNRRPSQITVADVVGLFETKTTPRKRRVGAKILEPAVASDQAARIVWNRIDQAVNHALTTTTLEELTEEARARHSSHAVKHPYAFHI